MIRIEFLEVADVTGKSIYVSLEEQLLAWDHGMEPIAVVVRSLLAAEFHGQDGGWYVFVQRSEAVTVEMNLKG